MTISGYLEPVPGAAVEAEAVEADMESQDK